jgi:hypothetical protein
LDLETANWNQILPGMRQSIIFSLQSTHSLQFKSFLYKEELQRHHVAIQKDEERYPDRKNDEYNFKLEGKWFPNGEAWYFFMHPEDCGTSKALKEMLPKRKKDVSNPEIYGLYIEQRHSVWQIFIPAFVVIVLTLGATLWFVPAWLKEHSGDLQNATVPLFLALAVVGLILQLSISVIIFRWSL